MKETSPYSTFDPELEARIVARVLGEASDFERDQLQQLIDQRPELAAFQARMQDVHGRLQDVATGESIDQDVEWKLAADKRQNLLAVISGESAPPTAKAVQRRSHVVTTPPKWSYTKVSVVVGSLTSIAVLVILVGLLLPSVQMARMSSRSDSERWMADAATPAPEAAFFDDITDSDVDYLEYTEADGDGDGAPDELLKSDSESHFGYRQDSQSSLGAIRGTLNQDATQPSAGYFADDIQSPPLGLAPPEMPARETVSRDKAESSQARAVSQLQQAVDAPDSPKPGNEIALNFAAPARRPSGEEAANGAGEPGGGSETSERFGFGYGGLGGGFGGEMNDPLYGMAAPTPTAPAQTTKEDFGRKSQVASDAEGYQESAATVTEKLSTAAPEELEDPNGRYRYEFRARSALQGIVDLNKGDKAGEQTDKQPSERGEEQEELLEQANRPVIAGINVWEDYTPPMLPTPTALNETAAADEAFSTFSLHVSDVSFKLAQAALAQGELPEPDKIRIEEFVNAFDYGDPMPSQREKVACRVEQSIHPFLQQRNLLRVSMRTAASGRASTTPLRLTLLLDNSGSMERVDRQQTVRRAFALLAQQLTPADQITLISFARQPHLLADQVRGDEAQQLVERIESLPSEGGTNIEAALQLAFEKAKEQRMDGAQNRIVLLTDGAVNLGDANPDRLSQMITTVRDAGIAFDAAGISAEGLNDEVLEALTRKGDGRYYLLDSFESADDGFARQLAGALRPSAKNVKVQIEFNSRRVGHYKLLGFEKHILNKEDFHNDAVDAAEMAAAEAGVAVYQFEAKPDGEGDVGSVSVRFHDLSTGQMVENRWPIPYQADAPRVDQAAPSLQIATAAALLAVKLRGEPLGETVDLKSLSNLLAGLPERERNTQRIKQLRQMIEQTLSLGL